MKRLIAFTGLAGSGKSTAAQHLVDEHGFTRVRFAGPLKNMMRAIGLTEAEIEGDRKEIPSDVLCGQTPRHAMQTLGTEWGREHIGSSLWVNLWALDVQKVWDAGGAVVCEDCRFPNEADAVNNLGGIVVKLEGRGGIAGGHASEAMQLSPNITISNTRSVEALHWALDALVKL